MNNEEKKSLGYSLFIDKDMDDLFHMFYNLFDSFEGFVASSGYSQDSSRVEGVEQMKKLKETYKRFLEVTSEPAHELGWCEDPECAWVPKEKKLRDKKG